MKRVLNFRVVEVDLLEPITKDEFDRGTYSTIDVIIV